MWFFSILLDCSSLFLETMSPVWLEARSHARSSLPQTLCLDKLICFQAPHWLVRWPSGYGASFRLTWNEFTSEKSRGFESHSDHHLFCLCIVCSAMHKVVLLSCRICWLLRCKLCRIGVEYERAWQGFKALKWVWLIYISCLWIEWSEVYSWEKSSTWTKESAD